MFDLAVFVIVKCARPAREVPVAAHRDFECDDRVVHDSTFRCEARKLNRTSYQVTCRPMFENAARSRSEWPGLAPCCASAGLKAKLWMHCVLDFWLGAPNSGLRA